MIKIENAVRKYYDRNGNEITDGCEIRYSNGCVKLVCHTNDGELGTDATNPAWIKSGRAVPFEYGVYPLSKEETEEVEVVHIGGAS